MKILWRRKCVLSRDACLLPRMNKWSNGSLCCYIKIITNSELNRLNSQLASILFSYKNLNKVS